MTIQCGRGNHTHETLLDVRACYNGEDVNETVVSAPVSTVVPDEAPATQKQIAFLTSLAFKTQDKTEADRITKQAVEGFWGKRSISDEINRLRSLPKRPAEKATESHEDGQTPATLEAGMYRLDGGVYKVQRNVVQGDGSRAYAKRLTAQECRKCGYPEGVAEHESGAECKFEPASWKFEYVQGAIHRLRPEMRMTLEEAKAFGKVYGTCCVCGRTLTNETSIEEGIGPVCGGRV